MRAAASGSRNVGCESGSSPTMANLNPKARGPIDGFVSAQARQATLNTKWKKEERKKVCQQIGRFFFSSGIPFNIANDPYYLPMFEGVANYGPGFVPPSMHELRTWILKDEVTNIDKMLDEHKKSWKQYGCSIMSDGWSDGKSRCFINFLVNSPAATFFLKSIDASDSIKSGELLAYHLNKVIDDWWMRFGGGTPELTRFAIRVLSLTCSSSGCERNWSTFKSIHTKKRNRLEHHRLNALVYVRYNTRLRERGIQRKMRAIDPILVGEVDSDDEWITEIEDPVLPEDPSWLDEENLFDVDVIRNVPLAPPESDITHESIIEVGNLGEASGLDPSNKRQKVSESVDVEGGERLPDVQIDDEVDANLVFDSH